MGRLAASIALCVIALIAIGYLFFRPNAESRKEYEDLRQLSGQKEGGGTLAYTNKQQRQNVQKDMWIVSENGRLHTRLNSKRSEIAFIQLQQESQIIERLFGITCLMQEKVYATLPDGREALLQADGRWLIVNADPNQPSSWVEARFLKPMQIVRSFQADTGTYFYHQNRLEADSVNIARYLLPGDKLPDSVAGKKPLMTGKASSVQFSFREGLQFSAHQFKATLFQGGPP